MLIATILLIAAGFLIVERLWPAHGLPRVRAWYPRVVLINAIQGAIVVLAGLTWDRWLQRASMFNLDERFDVVPQGAHRLRRLAAPAHDARAGPRAASQ